MQLFEAFELKEYPYMETKEVIKGETIGDIINEKNNDKVYLIVDHDGKRIWTYNGLKSPFKLQVYGGILASMLRKQLKLFYKVFPLNRYSEKDKEFIEVMEKLMGGGRARAISKEDFPKTSDVKIIGSELSVHPYLNVGKAFEYLSELPKPEKYIRKFMLVGGNIYSDEEITESFVKEQKTVIKPAKMGKLNRGFTFFKDLNYTTRLIVKDRKVQAIELYTEKDDKPPLLELTVPIIYEEKFSNIGDMNLVVNAFQIPDELPEMAETEETPPSEQNQDSA